MPEVVGYVSSLGYVYCIECFEPENHPDDGYGYPVTVYSDNSANRHDTCEICGEPING